MENNTNNGITNISELPIRRNLPRPDEVWRHFKGNLYLILSVAIHTETKELFVCYRALYGDFGYYVRPLDMFLSEVDREKYPDVEQMYRFERVAFN